MSEELQKENALLKQQADQNSAGIHGLLAQLDAHKAMLNESLTASLHLRTNMILVQKSNKELADKNIELKKLLDEANKRLADIEEEKKACVGVAETPLTEY